MRYKFLALGVVSLLILSGCVATGEKFNTLEKPNEGMAKAYFLRQSAAYGSATCPSIKIGGKKIGCLKMKGYISADVEPGKKTLKWRNQELLVEFREGETSYHLYIMSGVVQSSGVGTYYSNGSDTFYKISEDRALKILQGLNKSS